MTSKFAPNSPWADEAIVRLKELWHDHQRSEIVAILTKEFGRIFTPDTVGAKAQRIGLRKPLFNKHKADKKSGILPDGTRPAPQRYIKRSAEQKGLQPIRFTPAIIIEPTKEQLAADKKLIDEWIATKGVTVCEPATFIPLTHDFNRVARSSKGGM